MPEKSRSLEEARHEISSLTLALVGLVNNRAAAAREVGAAKAAGGAELIRDLGREQQVVDMAVEANEGPLSNSAVARIIQTVMNEASRMQSEEFGIPLGIPLDQGPGFGPNGVTQE
ncbi:MAG TPA: chorismate mutase [Patescibacteria group bacterium]|nr:chorismate mutase [Patescibacteria group bacterium]